MTNTAGLAAAMAEKLILAEVATMIGTTQLTYTKGSGQFHCPSCDQLREFRHRRKREFLTVYFIPLIPLQLVAEFLQCGTCRGTFDPATADMTPEQIRGSQLHATTEMIRRVLVAIVAADDVVTDEELAAVRDFARQYDQPEISVEQILHEAMLIRESETDLLHYISHVAQRLSSQERELLVHHAFLVATAGGDLTARRQDLLKNLPQTVAITEHRFREIIAQAADS